MSIEELTEQIAGLDLRIQQLEDDKKALVKSLRQEDEDISEKIQVLVPKAVFDEREKKLEEEIANLKKDKENLKKEVESLKAESRKDKESIGQSKKEIESLRGEMKWLKDDLAHFKAKWEDQAAEVKLYKAKTDDLEKSRNVLYIGQLFAKCMEVIYREILPEYFEDKNGEPAKIAPPQPHLNKIEKNIENLCLTKEEQDKRKAMWRKRKEDIGSDYLDLMAEDNPSQFEAICREIMPESFLIRPKQNLRPKNIEQEIEKIYQTQKKRKEKKEIWRKKKEEIGSDFVNFMENSMRERNCEAHPNLLKEEELRKIAETMPQKEKSCLEIAMKLLPIEYLGSLRCKYFFVGVNT